MRHFFILFLASSWLATCSHTTQAQTYMHTAVWTRLAPSYTLTKHWTVVGDLYYRRQSHPDLGLRNPLDSPLVTAARVGINYRRLNWSYTLFPAVYFDTYPALGTSSDLKRADVPEWRPSALVEWTIEVSRQSAVRLRAGYEYRMFTTPGFTDLGRMRFRAAWRRKISPYAYGQIWNETLLSAPPNLPPSGNLFDLNRTNLAVGYALSNISSIEVGYQFTHRQRRTLVEFDDEHALTVTLFLNIHP